MSVICLLDGSVLSFNLGDQIITECIKNELESVFPNQMIVNTYTHGELCRRSHKLIDGALYTFVGGTNLLSSDVGKSPWKLKRKDKIISGLILLGVGASGYSKVKDRYTKRFYKKILNEKMLHSVRDEYTKNMLRDIGVFNVVNTACPTMWGLTPEHCQLIPRAKSDSCVFTLTDYRCNHEKDEKMIDALCESYKKIYFWPQGSEDLEYFRSLSIKDVDNIKVLNPSLNAYRELLNFEDGLDYVGTRLHAGIYAMRYKRRSVIIGVDNRASEISKDTGLLVLERSEIESLQDILSDNVCADIRLPIAEINRWKNQFFDNCKS